MKKTTFLFVLFALLLSACGTGQMFGPSPTPTLTPTPTPTPIPPTPTPHPIKVIALEEVLLQAGELPMNCEAGEISEIPIWEDAYLAEFPNPDNSIYQKTVCSGDIVGSTTIFLYEDATNVKTAYDLFSKDDLVDGVGEQASGKGACGYVVKPGVSAGMACWAGISFRRCNATVTISLSEISSAEAGFKFVYQYAQQLDKALAPVVCLEN